MKRTDAQSVAACRASARAPYLLTLRSWSLARAVARAADLNQAIGLTVRTMRRIVEAPD